MPLCLFNSRGYSNIIYQILDLFWWSLSIFATMQEKVEGNDASVYNSLASGISSVDCIGPQELKHL